MTHLKVFDHDVIAVRPRSCVPKLLKPRTTTTTATTTTAEEAIMIYFPSLFRSTLVKPKATFAAKEEEEDVPATYKQTIQTHFLKTQKPLTLRRVNFDKNLTQ